MRILVEPSAHQLANVGDVAMLQVAVRRLGELWPDAAIGVITDASDRLAVHCPGSAAVPAAGRRLWFDEPYVGARVHRMLPGSVADAVRAGEKKARGAWPAMTESTIRLRRRAKRLGSEELDEFRAWSRSSDLVLASGAGLLCDPFPHLACTVLELLEAAAARGAGAAMLGQGVGPVTDANLRAVARRVLPRVEPISLREERFSRPLLRELGVRERQMITTGDDAIELAFRPPWKEPTGQAIGLGVRVARYSEVGERALASVGRAVRRAAARYGAELVPVPISSEAKERDAAVIAGLLGAEGVGPDQLTTPAAVVEQVGRCRVVVTGSYHAAVFALAQGIPAVGLAASGYYVHKFLGLADQFGGGCALVRLDANGLDERIDTAIDQAWTSAPRLAPRLLEAAERQLEQSREAYRRLKAIVAGDR